MRHGKKINHLSRKKGHRRALLANQACSLIKYKRIQTTTAKAKALRRYIEPLITKAKTNTTQNRRVVFGYLQNKEAVTELFDAIAQKIGDRPGGYTRVIRLGNRQGDNAEISLIELVDFNETYVLDKKAKSTGKKKRTRRGKKKSNEEAAPAPAAENKEEVVEETAAIVAEEKTEAVVEEAVAETTEAVETTEEIVAEAVEEEKQQEDAAVEEETNNETEEDKA